MKKRLVTGLVILMAAMLAALTGCSEADISKAAGKLSEAAGDIEAAGEDIEAAAEDIEEAADELWDDDEDDDFDEDDEDDARDRASSPLGVDIVETNERKDGSSYGVDKLGYYGMSEEAKEVSTKKTPLGAAKLKDSSNNFVVLVRP